MSTDSQLSLCQEVEPEQNPNTSVWQEIHCTNSGGGCGGFVLVKLDVYINGRVTVVCPKCQHRHERYIKDGQVLEEGRGTGKSREDICPTIAAWSATPRTRCMQQVVEKKQYYKERDGVVITNINDFIKPPYDMAEMIVRESFTERFLGRTAG